MHYPARPINAEICRAATERSAGFLSMLDAHAKEIDSDPDRFSEFARRANQKLRTNVALDTDRDRRLGLQTCVLCHYEARIAGAAICTQPCALCGEDQTYSSTSTSLLCTGCAAAHDLCRHCGADIRGHVHRSDYPCSDTEAGAAAGG